MRNSGLDLEKLSLEWNNRDMLYALLKKFDASYLCLSCVLRNIVMSLNVDSEVDSSDTLLNVLQGLDDETKKSTEVITSIGYLYFEIFHRTLNSDSVAEDMEACNIGYAHRHLMLLVSAQQFCYEKSFPLIQTNIFNDGNGSSELRQVALIRHVFDRLYKSKIVSLEAFWNWKEDLTVTQQIGKGQALIQTNEWFSTLSGLTGNNSEEEEPPSL
ncbi:Eukaryotic translation initiation factor isoform 4G-1 [Galdieria sulphuraria]|nr:Eukaryotic translation initiation factor isoform 4G-1 [Galdieria sulphuraria]